METRFSGHRRGSGAKGTVRAGRFPESTSFGNWGMRVRIPSDAPTFRISRAKPRISGGVGDAFRPSLKMSAARARKEVKKMAELVHPELLESLAPTVESLAEATGPLGPAAPETPAIPEALPAAPEGPAVPIPEDDVPLAGPLAPASEPVAEALPDVSAVFAELPAAPLEPA